MFKMKVKNILKKILGKKIITHKIAIVANVRYFKQYYGSKKIFLFLFYYLYKNIFETIYSGRTEVKIHGFTMNLIPDDKGISKELQVFKTHEPLVTHLLNKTLKSNMHCIDIGGNIGYYVLQECSIIGKNGKVIAFEPSPRNFNFLNDNLKINHISNVESFNLAIGDVSGQKKFLLTEASNSSHIVDDSFDHSDTISVKMMTLDEFLLEKNIEKIDFLRMDIEGSEVEAYSGMKQTIKKFKPSILMEVHNSYLGTKKTIDFLKKLKQDGYDIEYYISRNVDVSFIGNFKDDVKNYSIDFLIDGIKNNSIPNTFHLFLKNSNYNNDE
jgi:FkbM family methyltransferase